MTATQTITRTQIEAVTAEVRALQQQWRDAGTEPEERWFATLDLESVASDGGSIVFIWHDQFGQRWGWRWNAGNLDDPDWRSALIIDLGENVSTGGWTSPDTDEWVRWLVRQGAASPRAAGA